MKYLLKGKCCRKDSEGEEEAQREARLLLRHCVQLPEKGHDLYNIKNKSINTYM